MRWIDALGPTVFLIDACVGPPEPDVRPPLEIWAEVQQDGPQWFLVLGASGWVDYSDADQFGGLWGEPTVSLPAGAPVGLEPLDPIWTGGLSCLEVELGPIPDDTTAVWLTGVWTNRLDSYTVLEEAPLPRQVPVYREDAPGGRGRCPTGGLWPRSRDECFRSPSE